MENLPRFGPWTSGVFLRISEFGPKWNIGLYRAGFDIFDVMFLHGHVLKSILLWLQ